MRIAFCGPIAARAGVAKGGVESGTRGIISELHKREFQLHEFPYPAPNRHRHPIIKGIAYFELPVLFLRVIMSSGQFDVLHFTILYRHFIYAEFALLLAAKLFRRPVLLHVRPGDWWLQYQQRSPLYRVIFRTMVRLSESVAVESHDLLEPMRLLGSDPIYLPSFVTEKPHMRPDDESQCDWLKLVYLGAINDAKGAPIALEARRQLELYGLKAVLKIVGGGDPGYVEEMRKVYNEPEVHWLGEVAHQDVRRSIGDSHFYLFPTTFIGEGHSNALNECMAEGLVPVVSDHGANANIVEDAGIVLEKESSANDYALAIRSVWCNGQWLNRSKKCTSIITEKYYAPAVMGRLIDAYYSLSKQK